MLTTLPKTTDVKGPWTYLPFLENSGPVALNGYRVDEWGHLVKRNKSRIRIVALYDLKTSRCADVDAVGNAALVRAKSALLIFSCSTQDIGPIKCKV